MSQLAFSFKPRTAFGEDSFFVSACNRDAHAWVKRWPEWLSYGLLIAGPHASGKTHLAHIWQTRTKALFLPPSMLTPGFSPAQLGGARHIVVDGADQAPHPASLLHLLNWLREQDGYVLLTATSPPAEWDIKLPDLRSRLNALPSATLALPDDELLKALLTKQLADRQLSVAPAVLAYLLQHMERSFAAAGHLAARLDEASLAQGRSISLPLARRLIEAG